MDKHSQWQLSVGVACYNSACTLKHLGMHRDTTSTVCHLCENVVVVFSLEQFTC